VRLTGLMSDLLDFGRPSRPDFSECDIEEVIEAAVSACGPLARRKTVEISWPRRVGAPRVLAGMAPESRGLELRAITDQIYATSMSTRGFFAAIINRVRAAPEGARRPCSHS